MNMIIFLFMNFVVIISSYLIAYKLLKVNNFIDSLIYWFIIYFAQIVYTGLILGILGILYLKNVILLNLAILLAVILFSKNIPSSFAADNKGVIDGLFKNKIIAFGITVILSFGIIKIFINLINPPFGWDSLNYHFTFPVEWLKHGNLDTPITVFDDPGPTYYPQNGSLFYLWLIMPLKNVFLADLGQVPFFILSFLAVYSISRKICINHNFSFYAAALFFVIPNFFKQLSIAYVDVMVAGLFFACIHALFLLNESFSRKNVLLYSLSLGLFLGTKTIALPYSILLLIPFVRLYFKNIKNFHLCIIFILAVLILGGFSYIKNFLSTGNPLYPLDLQFLGKTIFNGVIDINTYRTRFLIDDYRLDKLLFHEGLGLQASVFILPSLFLTLPVTFLKKRKPLTFILGYFLILPVLIYLIYRYGIPYANTRYLYPLLGIGIVVAFYTAQILNIPKRIIGLLFLACILASAGELAKRQELIASGILTLLSCFFLPFLLNCIRTKKIFKKSSLIFLSLVFVILFLAALEKNYIKYEYPRYIKMTEYSGFWPDAVRAWDWLNSNTQGNNIAYAGRPVPFPLYGSNFKNNVYYVSVNKMEPAKLHYFPDSHYQWDRDFLSLHKSLEAKGNYRSDADYAAWLSNLIRRNTDYLFVYSLHQIKDIAFPIEDVWAKANLEKFSLAFANETIHIYKIRSSM